MTEHPILFNAEMVRAILSGAKTQTRRPIKPQPKFVDDTGGKSIGGKYWDFGWCYYWPSNNYVHCWDDDGIGCGDWTGDRYPQENILSQALEVSTKTKKCPLGKPGDTLWVRETFQPLFKDGFEYRDVDYTTGEGYRINYVADGSIVEFMDEHDGLSTACKPSIHMKKWMSRITLEITDVRVERIGSISGIDALAEGIESVCGKDSDITDFAELWDSIYKKKGLGWRADPWCWVIEFKMIDK